MQPNPDEVQNLRRCVRDLVALSTLPAIWGNADRLRIGRGLAEVLLHVLGVDFLYVRLHRQDGQPPDEAARTRRRTESAERAHEIGQVLAPWLRLDNADAPPSIPNPVGDGTVRLAVFSIGHAHDYGLLAAGCGRSNFPTDSERLLLGVAVNQAAGLLQRKEAEEALREADRRKDEFLAMLAHELRNPLAPIRNGLQAMKLARDNAINIEQFRSMMERQLAQLIRLVDDLMDLSRISRGKIVLRKERVELGRIIHMAVETSRPLIEANGHNLTIDVPSQPICVDADVTRLAQVVSNLLNNAAKYTERGGRIALTVQRQTSDVVIRVRDTGVGIPAPMLSKVFEMFTQVDRSLEKAQGGLGIGLTLVKRLIEMHGGSVEAHSDGHGKGSEFVVRLPIASSGAGQQQGEDAGAKASAIACRRILVVDDNEDAANSLSMMLEMMGNEVHTAHDGLSGVDAAAAFRPDLILLDIGMPRLNGYDVCRRIREQPGGKNIVIFALTGWGQDEDKRRSHESGFDGHLVKPVELTALEKLLAELKAETA